MPTRNPADKVHYTVRIGDLPLWHWTFPKWVLSGRVNSIIDACWHSSLPSPFRAYPKENPVLLGREYLNRTNRPVDIFASEQTIELGLVNWNVYYPYRFQLRRSIDLRRRERSIYFI